MTSSIFTREYELFRNLLITARKNCSYTQAEMATILGKPQSFISKYESGERRLDLIEFLQIAKVLKIDPCEIIKKLE